MSFFEQTKVEPGSSPLVVDPKADSHNPSNDAFGRLRISSPATLFDGKMLNNAAPLKFDDQQVSGSGTTSTFNTNQASVSLGVNAGEAGKRVRQTFRKFNYLPGKSQLVLTTFVLGTPGTGITKEVGYCTDTDGLLVRQTSSGVDFVQRTFTSGSTVETNAAQAAWNIDPMDGTGPSGKTIDFSKTQILVIDFEWLGVGRVRFGFNIDGLTFYCHEFLNANTLDVVYMSTPNLPIRYSIENDGTGGVDELVCICSTVISEGGQDPIGQTFGVANAAIRTGINGTGATKYALLGGRLKTSFADKAVVIPVVMSLVGTTTGDAFAYELIVDPIIAGSPVWVGVTDSAVEWLDGTSANTVTGGTVIASGVAFSRSFSATFSGRDNVQLGTLIDGTPQSFAVCIRPYQNMAAVAGVTWRELS